MNAFVLIITSCLSSGGDCYSRAEAQDLREMECKFSTQPFIAKWSGEHPKRKVVRYTCVPEKRVGFYLGRGEA